MKNFISKNWFSMLVLIAFVGTIFSGLHAAGVSMALIGTVVTGDAVTVEDVKAAAPTLDRDYVSRKITQMRPASTPLDTMTREIGNVVDIKSFVTNFYAVDSRPLKDLVGVAGYVTVADVELAAIPVDDIDNWSKDDTALVPSMTGNDGQELALYVSDIDAATSSIKVQALNVTANGNGKIQVPSIAGASVLIRMGNAKSEKDANTDPFAIIPEKDYNYCQLFMAQVEESIYQRMHDQEVDWGFSDYEALNIYDMRARMELSFTFGFRHKMTDKTDKDVKYFTGGVKRQLTKALEYGAAGVPGGITNDKMIDWSKDIFVGNSGSETRVLLAGATLNAEMAKADTVAKQIEAGKTQVKWGITFKEIETNFGTLLVKHVPLFDIAGYSNNGMVLDMSNIEKHVFLPTQVTDLELKKAGIKNADASVIAETSCLVLRYPDTHAWVKVKA
jgi:hypothetical protein